MTPQRTMYEFCDGLVRLHESFIVSCISLIAILTATSYFLPGLWAKLFSMLFAFIAIDACTKLFLRGNGVADFFGKTSKHHGHEMMMFTSFIIAAALGSEIIENALKTWLVLDTGNLSGILVANILIVVGVAFDLRASFTGQSKYARGR